MRFGTLVPSTSTVGCKKSRRQKNEAVDGADKNTNNRTTIVDLNAEFGSQQYVPQGIIIHDESLIWNDISRDAIYRSNLNGSDAALLVDTAASGSFSPRDVATDAGSFYWSDDTDEALYRSNLDCTNASKLIDLRVAFGPDDCDPDGIDMTAGVLYWADSFQRGIYRANSDGTDIIELIDLDSVFGEGHHRPSPREKGIFLAV